MTKINHGHNPIIKMDYPDPDVIYVDGVYYMISTTMHFLPGGQILRSYDLLSWEHAAYVFDYLDSTPAQRLEGDRYIYGKGMWAASLRYHRGCFYVVFVCNDTQKTYLYRSEKIEGPWRKSEIEGFYHDSSLLFDEDRVFIVYGNTKIYLTELNEELSGPKEGGLHRLLVQDVEKPRLGYEGSHLYKINGRYYLFMIHSLQNEWRRVEACYSCDSLEGEFTGGDIFNDDMGFRNSGVAQGGIVQGVDGIWNAVLFQDSGAIGRLPVLVPVSWEGDRPVFGIDGKAEKQPALPCSAGHEDHVYAPLYDSDDFRYGFPWNAEITPDKKQEYGCFGLKSFWQFNHEPDLNLVSRDDEDGILWITTDKLSMHLNHAKNTLTQRMVFPSSGAQITVDPSFLKEGDCAGLCVLQGNYCWVGIEKRDGKLYQVMYAHISQEGPWDLSEVPGTKVEERLLEMPDGEKPVFRIKTDFSGEKDTARCFVRRGESWDLIGKEHPLCFRLDHFCGARFGLFIYSTKETGGRVGFSDFRFET
ncbi:MAG: family 43 glycosylhydrolase [Clostridiales bacterium]|nr:family 43 glycosylhydrolase [Clostridiales bacterium]